MSLFFRYEQDNESFKIKVAQSIEKAQELLYVDPDPEDDHAIRYNCITLYILATIYMQLTMQRIKLCNNYLNSKKFYQASDELS